jgi:O-6-methylguanine DNA methyltransferase
MKRNSNFTNPVSFSERVRVVVGNIPKGSVMTYKEVAIKAGNPGAARAVGTIMSRNTNKKMPCHRVIRSDGKIGGYNRINGPSKQALLKEEKISNIFSISYIIY